VSVPYSIFSLGDQAVSLEIKGDAIDPAVHDTLRSMKEWIEKNSFIGLRDIVLGYRSVSVTFDLLQVKNSGVTGSVTQFVNEKLRDAFTFASQHTLEIISRHVKIPVCYDSKFGFDLEKVCEHSKLSLRELIDLHSGPIYKVYLVGFLPGFPYLGFVDQRLEMPRHNSPRAMIPAGSVGIAGKQTGIYPFDSPGGWQIIGRTPIKMFDPAKKSPVVVEAGDTVSFYSIRPEEFDNFKNDVE
jgi:inhibitor of KinA